MLSEVFGFGDFDSNDEKSSRFSNNNNKTRLKKSGGFESMGLSLPVLKGIKKRGYQVPTPIQRKTIPLALEGRDLVAMARTGSGKTACFLLPLLERLRTRCAQTGARAVVMSPTRELALQTFKFLKDLGCYTGLRAALVLGGDSMDDQFDAMHSNPDVIVATPGRLVHLCVEMELKLSAVEYVVFDEADRLFEMGFGEQLREFLARLPETRQTLLFSATLPRMLVDFAKAGLADPVLLRLDVESKLPEHLKLGFVCCRSEEKPAALLCLLKYVVPPAAQTIVFAATKHHVEYLHLILDAAGISNTFIYSNLDAAARKINTAKFDKKKASVLVVTDVAARGIDIPQLDVVINYSFPAKPKLFVHRVGRCARAGRSGVALSLLVGDERPYLLDVLLFLGRGLGARPEQGSPESWADGSLGTVPRALLEEEHARLLHWHHARTDLAAMQKVCGNAHKQYVRSRPGASTESVRRSKQMDLACMEHHPAFISSDSPDKITLLQKMKTYKPQNTVFEISQMTCSESAIVMKAARQKHKPAISNFCQTEDRELNFSGSVRGSERAVPSRLCPQVNGPAGRKRKTTVVDDEFYVPYMSVDHHSENGLAVQRSFAREASGAELSLTGDSEDVLRLQSKLRRLDTRSKKMVGVSQEGKKKILSESGVWIPATFKTDRYNQWKEKSKVVQQAEEQEDSSGDEDTNRDRNKKTMAKQTFPNTHWGRHNKKVQQKTLMNEFKRPEQILKLRLKKEEMKRRMLRNVAKRSRNRAR